MPMSQREFQRKYEIITDLPTPVARLAQRPAPPGWTYYLILDLKDPQPKYRVNMAGELVFSRMEPPLSTEFAPDCIFFRDGTVVLENRAYASGERIVHNSPTLVAYRPAAPGQLLRITNQNNELFAFAFDARGWWRYVPRSSPYPAQRNPIPTRRELLYLAGFFAVATIAFLLLAYFGHR